MRLSRWRPAWYLLPVLLVLLILSVLAPPSPSYAADGTLVSDDFTDGSLSGAWTVVDPVGDGTASMTGSALRLSLPAGSEHDIWYSGNRSLRAVQAAADRDFTVEVAFTSVPSRGYQMQGLLVEQGPGRFLRIDTYSDGNRLKLFQASFTNGAPAIRSDTSVPTGTRLLRLTRTGTTYATETSVDGAVWTAAPSFNDAITVNRVGVFAGNAAGSGSPAWAAEVDHFRVGTATPPMPPVISAVAVVPAATSAKVSWTTDLPSDSLVESGTTSSYGQRTYVASLVTDHVVQVDGLRCATTYRYRVSSAARGASSASTDASFTTSACPAQWSSDAFDGSVLGQHWTVEDPVTGGSVSVAGGAVSLGVRAGTDHDVWSGGNRSLRITQALPSGELDAAVRFRGAPTARYSGQGLLLTAGPGDFIRFDTYANGTGLRLFAAVFDAGAPRVLFDTAVTGARLLRLQRAVNGTVTFLSSSDGTAWQQAGSLPWNRTPTSMGVFASNASGSTSPAWTATVESVTNLLVEPLPPPPPPPTDTTPPVLSNVQVSVSTTSAAVSWTTDEPATSVLRHGLTADYGSVTPAGGPDGTAHEVVLQGLACDTAYAYRPRSTDRASNVTDGPAGTFRTRACASTVGGVVSDDFSSSELHGRWTFEDPLGDSRVSVTGTAAVLYVPPGRQHDMWTGRLNAPRLLQPVDDGDLDAVVRFDSVPELTSQTQGILFKQDADDFLRFDMSTGAGGGVRLFAASIAGGQATTRVNTSAAAAPDHLRVTRRGSTWTFAVSTGGVTWTTVGSFNQSFSVTAAGPFAGNYNGSAPLTPAFAAQVDFFFDPSKPVSPEDGGRPRATTPGPVYDVWYGDRQSFGAQGVPQNWINLVGSVSDADGVGGLWVSVNGGARRALRWGPNGTRLVGQGDFNAELERSQLSVGDNVAVLTAMDVLGNTSTTSVTVVRAPDRTWPMPYTANWSSGPVQSVAQVVDGKWTPEGNGVRTVQTGYDRLLALGDRTYAGSSEVRTSMTIHSMGDPKFEPGVGILTGWQGHGGFNDPYEGHALGGLGWVSRVAANTYRLRLLANEDIVQRQQDIDLRLGVSYTMVFRTAVQGNGTTTYSMKMWPSAEPEPAAFALSVDLPSRAGSAMLVAHHSDVTFGPTTLLPLP